METSFPHFHQSSDLGKVEIAPDVLEIIAGLAASEVEGVVATGGGIVGGIAERLGKKNLAKGVKVELGEEQTIVDISIGVEYGVRIPSVAMSVQENIKTAIQNMTGLDVIQVNVHVVSVNVKQTGEEHK